ncbi:UDP-Glycosyltransferase/glycogen phosphorylase, partial [Caulochytrium protostelioides]
TQFRIAVRPERLVLVRLQSCRFAEAKTWPRLTLILQSLGAIIPAIEALWKLPCHVFVETVGYAFVYPVARLWACTVVTYTHYPTISTNMLDKVASRRPDFNNSSLIARYPLLSHIKYAYYRLFAALYGAAGRAAHVVMLNSRWTAAHVCALWHLPPAAAPSPSAAAASRRQAFLVYPPCDTEALQQSSLDERTRTIVYVAQFRPEKAHPLVLEAFAAALADPGLSAADADAAATWRLELIGGARHPADQARAAALAARARHHGLADRVVLRPNAPYPVLAQALATAAIGVHAMADEHFGICIVEYMAAGCLVLAHGSGGPATDILDPGVSGVLATTLAEYTAGLVHLMTMPPARQLAMRTAARTKAATFSNARFHDGWMAVLSPLLPPEPRGRKNP